MRKNRRRQAGLFGMEALISLIMAILLLMSMTAAVAHVQRAQRDLARQRAMARRLEAGLLALQSGGSLEKDLTMERLAQAAPAGQVWVQVSPRPANALSRAKEHLVGLVPVDKAPAGGVP